MNSVAGYTFLALLAGLAFLLVLRRSYNESIPHGYTKLGLNGASNMLDEYDSKYTVAAAPPNKTTISKWKVKALFIHPIKSCAAIELTSADVNGTGFVWDRKFSFAELLTPQTRLDASEEEKKPTWTFRTQRTPGFERLAHVYPEIWLRNDASGLPPRTENTSGFMVVRYPYMLSGSFAPLTRILHSFGLLPSQRSFRVPLEIPESHQYPSEQVVIWRNSPRWLNFGVHVPDDFRLYLGVKNPLTLFRVDPRSYREVFRCAPRKEQLGYQSTVGFADAYPVHLLNITSVHDIGERIKNEIPHFSARRFRSNILVQGPAAYNEDDWKRIRVGKHLFYCACHTVRCRLPNVDPDTAERHPVEPDKTLKSFRCIDDGDPLNACLGLQLVPAESETFRLQIGDEIQVLERGEHHYIKQ